MVRIKSLRLPEKSSNFQNSQFKAPFSNFIFRMKDGPKGALFEADGGVWRNDAIANIANYLHDRLIGEPAERGEEPFNVTIIA